MLENNQQRDMQIKENAEDVSSVAIVVALYFRATAPELSDNSRNRIHELVKRLRKKGLSDVVDTPLFTKDEMKILDDVEAMINLILEL
jgi:DNA helicase TIP49 (TBP-interacting protein)